MSRRAVLLTEGLSDPLNAKTAVCLLRYCPDEVTAVLDSTQAGRTAEQVFEVGGQTPIIASLDEAPPSNTLVIGVAPAGGKLPPVMRAAVLGAIERGWNVVSGLHQFLSDDREFVEAARRKGVELVDVRKNNEREVATREGLNDRCLRIHTVGSDCSVGKMVVSLELARALQRGGHDAKFVATGQTGIMIEGDGCPIDCVVADFINGAAERLVRANEHRSIIVVEGQGSLIHPSYSAVTLGLLHGCVPDGLIFCYEVGRKTINRRPHIPIPPINEVMELYRHVANAAHPCRFIAVAMNSRLCKSEQDVETERQRVRQATGLPVCDVIRHGPDELASAVLRLKSDLGK